MTDQMFAVLGLGGGELIILLFVLLLLGGLLIAGLAVAAYFVIRSLNSQSPAPAVTMAAPASMPPKADQQKAEPTNMAGFRFRDVNLSGADFEKVNLSNARFHDVNLSNLTMTAAQMGGAVFKHIGPPPDAAGKQERQRPVRFEEMMLCDSIFQKVDLSNVRVTECDLTGMTVDGVLLTDLIAAYQKQQPTL